MKNMDKFKPQIENVRILDYPVKEGSGNIGISADVLGVKKNEVINLMSESAWRKASADEKPIVAMGIAAQAFRNHLFQALGGDLKKLQSAGELMYWQWDRDGRRTKGQEWDILVNDRKTFPDNEETEIVFDVHDGFAVGVYEDKEYLMTYPTRQEVMTREAFRQNIENYIGHAVTANGIISPDIAMTCGKITGARDLSQWRVDWSAAERVIYNNACLRPKMFDEILRHEGITHDSRFPTDKDGLVQRGYLLVTEDKVTEFRLPPRPGDQQANDVFFRDWTDELDKTEQISGALYEKWRNDLCRTRISDISVNQAPGNENKFIIRCKVDGQKQIGKALSEGDARFYREIEDMFKAGKINSSHRGGVVRDFAVQYFLNAVSQEQQQNRSMKR